MSYAIKELFKTLQGEAFHSGRAAVFCRFSGCNLWSGREADRATAQCSFCDTNFIGSNGHGGERFADANALVDAIEYAWGGSPGPRYVVCTGGEPLLQVDDALIVELHARGFEIGIETNGTLIPPSGIDWICVSPKAGTEVVLRRGNEIKIVFPQPKLDPTTFEDWSFDHFFIQPMDSGAQANNIELAVTYCLEHPKWRLSLQTHKIIGIP